MKFFLSAFMFVFCWNANAQVIKCKDVSGKVTYGSTPCTANATSSSVNLSGANITEQQLQEAQNRSVDDASNRQSTSNSVSCQTLKGLADNTYASFLENTNPNRWGVAFQSLQSLVGSCPSKDVCQIAKERVDHAQRRYAESNTSYRGSQLNSVTTLYAQNCQGGTQRPNTQRAESTEGNTSPKSHFMTKDQFGTTVRSDRCYWTKDAFGTSVKSAGCN